MVSVCAGPGDVWDWSGGSGVAGLSFGDVFFARAKSIGSNFFSLKGYACNVSLRRDERIG